MTSLRLTTLACTLLFGIGTSSVARAENAKHACVAASTQGQTLRDDGKLLEAREQILSCAREECPTIVRNHCIRWLSELDEQIPGLVVRVKDGNDADLIDVMLTVDGHAMKLDGRAIRLNPGEHVVVVEAPGWGRKEERVLLVDREKAHPLLVRLARQNDARPGGTSESSTSVRAGSSSGLGDASPPSADRSAPIPVGAWVLGGVGVVALGSFTFFGLSAMSDFDTAKNHCAPHCTTADTNSARTKAIVADVSLGVGIVGIAAGVTWAILSRPGSSSASIGSSGIDIRPTVGGAVAVFTGRY